MGALFNPPKPQAPPPVPQIDNAISARNASDTAALRRGMGATMLTGENGLPNLGTVAKPAASASPAAAQ